MEQKAEILQLLQPILARLAQEDASAPDVADRLNAELSLESEVVQRAGVAVRAGVEAGWLCPKGGNGVQFGRLTRSEPASHGFSIDAVDMDRPGPEHIHPNGEFNLCFSLSGSPTFDGQPPGWVVLPPGSQHIPTVAGGRMAILYFLPEGAIRFV